MVFGGEINKEKRIQIKNNTFRVFQTGCGIVLCIVWALNVISNQ